MTGSGRQAGFSLVELMIVVSIIGIMAAIGIPSFQGLLPRIRLNSNTMVLSNEIALARVRAISKSTDFRIVFSPNNDRYSIWKYNGSWQSMGSTLLTGTDLFSADGGTADWTLVSSSNGLVNVPLNSQGIIELRTPSGDHRKRVIVEATGRMFVERWNGGAWTQE